MAKTEPIRHHYIPQFILKNFADPNGYLNYFNKEIGKNEYVLPKEVFQYKNLYRDDKNNPGFPTETELGLANLENDASQVLKKFLNGNEIILSKQEEELLRVFLFVMNFRTPASKDFFVHKLSDADKRKYAEYQPDGNMESWWKRNLSILIKCRTINDILKSDIDKYLKQFVMLDLQGPEGSYFMIYRVKGNQKLYLSDVNPLCTKYGSLIKYRVFYMPISSDRILIFMKKSSIPFDYDELLPSKKFCIEPTEIEAGYKYTLGKAFNKFAVLYNGVVAEQSKHGYILPPTC